MKKLKKFVLSSSVYRLTNIEQMNVVGGDTAPTTGCGGKSKDECSGICHAYGYEGSCGWTSKPSPGSCTCGVVYIYGGYTGED